MKILANPGPKRVTPHLLPIEQWSDVATLQFMFRQTAGGVAMLFATRAGIREETRSVMPYNRLCQEITAWRLVAGKPCRLPMYLDCTPWELAVIRVTLTPCMPDRAWTSLVATVPGMLPNTMAEYAQHHAALLVRLRNTETAMIECLA